MASGPRRLPTSCSAEPLAVVVSPPGTTKRCSTSLAPPALAFGPDPAPSRTPGPAEVGGSGRILSRTRSGSSPREAASGAIRSASQLGLPHLVTYKSRECLLQELLGGSSADLGLLAFKRRLLLLLCFRDPSSAAALVSV